MKGRSIIHEDYTGEDGLFYGTGNYVCHIALRREAYRDGMGNNCTCHLMHGEQGNVPTT